MTVKGCYPQKGWTMPDIIERNMTAARQLLECAAEIERLRGALTKIAAIEDKMYGPDWEEIEEAREIARGALRAERDLTKGASNEGA